VQPASIGAITAHASRSVGATSTSDTLIPSAFHASARSRCGLISVVTAVPSSNATANSTGRGRDIRPTSPTISIPIAQYRRAPESRSMSSEIGDAPVCLQILGQHWPFSTSPVNDVQRPNAT